MTDTQKQARLQKDIIDITSILNSEHDFSLPNSLKSENLLHLLPDQPDSIDLTGRLSILKRIIPIVATATAALFAVVIFSRSTLLQQDNMARSKMLPEAAPETTMVEEAVMATDIAPEAVDIAADSAAKTGAAGGAAYAADNTAPASAMAVEDSVIAENADTLKTNQDNAPKLIQVQNWRNYQIDYSITVQEDGISDLDILLIEPSDSSFVHRLVIANTSNVFIAVQSQDYLYFVTQSAENNYFNKIMLNGVNELQLIESEPLDKKILDTFEINNCLYIIEGYSGKTFTDSTIELTDSMENESTKITVVDLANDTKTETIVYGSGNNISVDYNSKQINYEYKNNLSTNQIASLTFDKTKVELEKTA